MACGQSAVLTLPTGTGKTLIAGMVAHLLLGEERHRRIIFTAPRRTLLSQLAQRTRWLNPVHPTHAVGIDGRNRAVDVRSAFAHAQVIFGMPEFLARRLQNGTVASDRVRNIDFLIIDEFDAFLAFKYGARGVYAELYDDLRELINAVGPQARVLLMSATTPEARPPVDAATTASDESSRDRDAMAAFRLLIDSRFKPEHVSLEQRRYAKYVPHAEIVRVDVEDEDVRELDAALSSEIGLLLNWISGAVSFHVSAEYVLPRLEGIIAGRFGLTPNGPRVGKQDAVLKGLLSRLQLMSHCGDFLFEDMFRGFEAFTAETFVYDSELVSRIPASKLRIQPPERVLRSLRRRVVEQIEAHPEPRAKVLTLERIVQTRKRQQGVLFLRYVRILDEISKRLRASGHEIAMVHGAQKQTTNDRELERFRKRHASLLLITRDTGKRGLDLPEADYAVFFSPKARDDVTWQEVSRIRSTIMHEKASYFLCYAGTAEALKMDRMLAAMTQSSRSITVSQMNVATRKRHHARAIADGPQ
jgi:ERCC4-related helicase